MSLRLQAELNDLRQRVASLEETLSAALRGLQEAAQEIERLKARKKPGRKPNNAEAN